MNHNLAGQLSVGTRDEKRTDYEPKAGLDGVPFESKQTMLKAMRDDRYKTDSHYHEHVKSRLMATDVGGVAGMSINRPLPLDGNVMSDLDQVNLNAPQGYNSIRQVVEKIRDPRYKSDPLYRLEIAGGIHAATPNYEPRTTDESYRVQFGGADGSGTDPQNSPVEA